MILLIDNYDSFVHNLARYIRTLGPETVVVRNDQIAVPQIRELQPTAIVLSPGPCAPTQAGCCLDVVRELHCEIPILGVCLGHQAIAQALGGLVVQSQTPVHGRASLIEHDCQHEFQGCDNPLRVGRYHSLVVTANKLPTSLCVSARLTDGTVMAIRHRELPVVGWQFHPESVLTENGYDLLRGFLRMAGVTAASNESPSEIIPDEATYGLQSDWFQRAIEFP